MGVSGLVFAVVVVGWAMFLVPMALRRHDQVARNRSIERFSSAMRVLSRTGSESGGASSGRVVVTPPRATDRVLSPWPRRPEESSVEPLRARPSRAAMKSAAARRRRVLMLLVAVTVVVGAVSAFGLLPRWSGAVPVALIAGFLWLARRQVRLATESYWAEAADAQPAVSNVVRRSAARVDASHGAARDDADDEPTITLTAAQLEAAAAADLVEQRVVAVSMTTADGGSLWDPLPVTLPTYVDKPIAKRTIRTIDLGEPVTWSSGHSAAASQTAAEAKADGDVVEEARRAANA